MIDDAAYFESKGFQDILKRYEEATESGQSFYMDADDLADIADYYQYHDRQEEADKAINLALSYNPRATGPLLYKAREALQANELDVAREYADQIQAADTLEGLYFRGEIMVCEGKIEEADQFFRESIDEVMPDEYIDYVYDVANLFFDYSVFDKAFEWMSRSQGDNSDDFKELMGRTLFGLGKYEDSERIFNELIDQNPYSARYWNALANAQYMREDYGAAITSSEFAIAINPNDVESILSKANSLYSIENYEEALSYFRKYSEQMPSDDLGYLHQGTCLINLGEYEEATRVLAKGEKVAQEDSPYLSETYKELAFAYGELHHPEKALYYLNKTSDLKCDHVNMEVIRGHILLANDRLEEAEEAFKQALKLSDNAQRTMLRIIVSLYDNHYVNSSYHLLKRFFRQVDKDWNDGYSYLVLCCMELRKKEETLHYLRMAIDRNPKEAKTVLGSHFPKGMEPEEYYDYMLHQIEKDEL